MNFKNFLRLVVLVLSPLTLHAYVIAVGPIVNTSSCTAFNVQLQVFNGGVFHHIEQSWNIPAHSTLPEYLATYQEPNALQNVTYYLVWVTIATNGPIAGQKNIDGSNPTGTQILHYPSSIDACNANGLCVATNTVYSWTVNNQGNAPALYWLYANGVKQCGFFGQGSVGGAGYGGMQLAPGQTGTFSTGPVPVGCGTTPPTFTLQQMDPQGQWTDCGGGGSAPNGPLIGAAAGPTGVSGAGVGSGGTITTGPATGATGGGVGSGTQSTTYQFTNQNPIVFNQTNSPGSTNLVTDGTMQEGLGAIYDAINRNGANVGNGLQTIDNELMAHRVIFNGMSNMLGTINSTTAGVTNLLLGISNLDSQALFRLSNSLVFQTNAFGALSNAVVTSGNNITNVLGAEISSNLANMMSLSNVVRGVSNAVISSGTNQGQFLSNSFYSVMSGLTNLGGGSNFMSDNGITNSINSEHFDVTNYLGQLTDTNRGSVGLIHGMSDVGAQFTNLDSARSVVEPMLGDAQTFADDKVSDADSLQAPSLPSGSLSGFTIVFAGTTLNLDPDAIIPGVTDFVYYLTELVVLVFFYLNVSRLYMEVMWNLGKTQTGGVPNLMVEVFGIGGNLLGLLVHPAICFAIITLWVSIVVVFEGRVPSGGLIAGALAHVAASGGSAASSAWYLIQKTIPVELILSLFGTRIALQWLMGKLVYLAAAIMRFFIGK